MLLSSSQLQILRDSFVVGILGFFFGGGGGGQSLTTLSRRPGTHTLALPSLQSHLSFSSAEIIELSHQGIKRNSAETLIIPSCMLKSTVQKTQRVKNPTIVNNGR